jgi:hypothetical protein
MSEAVAIALAVVVIAAMIFVRGYLPYRRERDKPDPPPWESGSYPRLEDENPPPRPPPRRPG